MRRCRTIEEWSEHSRLPRILIAHNSNDAICAKNSWNPRWRLALINGFDAEVASKLLKPLIDETVSLPAHDSSDRNPPRRNRCSSDLPVSVMSSDQNNAAADGQCVVKLVPSVRDSAIHYGLRIEFR